MGKFILNGMFVILLSIITIQYGMANEGSYSTGYNSYSNNNYFQQPVVNNNADRFQNNSASIVVPSGLRVPIRTQSVITSKDLTTDTKVNVVVASDVYYNNMLIFKSGTVGYLYPSSANKAKRFGVNGEISISSAYVKDITGKEQLLSIDYSSKGKKRFYSAGAGVFAKSDNAVISPGEIIFGNTVSDIFIK